MTLHVSLRSTIPDINETIADQWRTERVLDRFWSGDATVWQDPPGPEIANRLGWLDAATTSRSLIPMTSKLHDEAVAEGITDIVLCGMGGSSLAPEVFSETLPHGAESPRLTVIDSTHPDAITEVSSTTEPATTWYIVASKSGGTIETMSLFRYFWDQAVDAVPNAGDHFIAITDPGTSLETLAAERSFRATIHGDPNVGGRYSALTAFGLVPVGLAGCDIGQLLDSAQRAAEMCGPTVRLEENPGFGIGVALAQAARSGRDKAQFLCSDPMDTIGAWIEQLVAESTGKEGTGIIPIDGGPTLDHRHDTIVVDIGGSSSTDAEITLAIDDDHDVAGAMFILEFATAVAGAVLGINPFDQPDVQEAKNLATSAMEGGLESGGLQPTMAADSRWLSHLSEEIANSSTSYISIQAYVPRNDRNATLLERLRQVLTEASGTHVTVGFGPRFLHSTGQLHKGGPPGGIYLQILGPASQVLPVPETGFTFNELIAAQASGDRAALTERGRTVIAVDLGAASDEALESLIRQVASTI